MGRNAFYSFHFKPDNWRAGQIRNMGVVEGNRPVSDNDWETVTRGGDAAIEKWIADQMKGRTCVVVLIGANTAGRKWITHEIIKGWNDGKGVVGVYVHGLKDSDQNQAVKGANPFASVTISGKTSLSAIAKAYDPPYSASASVYDFINTNLESWVDEGVQIRGRHP